jgi:hypothetical protein
LSKSVKGNGIGLNRRSIGKKIQDNATEISKKQTKKHLIAFRQ